MKKTTILSLMALFFLPSIAFAQWNIDTTFVPVASDNWRDIHGVAVDPDGKVWMQPYYATDSVYFERTQEWKAARVIYVYNADGTPADFSPLKVITFSDGSSDTLGVFWDPTLNSGDGGYDTRTGRGISTDVDGNILISQWNVLYKVDYKTAAGLARVEPGIGSLTEATSDADGNIYVSAVAASDMPIIKYDPDLKNPEEVVTLTQGYSRDFEVSADGMEIYWAGYTLHCVLKYSRPDEFSGFNAIPDTVLKGMDSESVGIHPVTGDLWLSAGSPNDLPNMFPGVATSYSIQTWYAFDMATLGTVDEIAKDSITWFVPEDGTGIDARPRGLGFTTDGKIAYVGSFGAPSPAVQKFEASNGTAISPEKVTGLPDGYKLQQNYPNPFNPTTNISYTIQDAGVVTLKVYDMTGREVATLVNSRMSAGEHVATFDASSLSSGVYIYSLNANGLRLTKRMTLIK